MGHLDVPPYCWRGVSIISELGCLNKSTLIRTALPNNVEVLARAQYHVRHLGEEIMDMTRERLISAPCSETLGCGQGRASNAAPSTHRCNGPQADPD